MDHAPFGLIDAPIAFNAARRATRLRKALHELGPDDARETEAILGIIPFTDDASVHADHWERHPKGDEILLVLDGRLLSILDGDDQGSEIGPGQALIVPQGRWHRLRVLEPGRLLFLTPTLDMELRPEGESAE